MPFDGSHLKRLYAEHGYEYETPEHTSVKEDKNSIVTETQQSLDSEESRVSQLIIEKKMSKDIKEDAFKKYMTAPAIKV